jgi:hypothetical protein
MTGATFMAKHPQLGLGMIYFNVFFPVYVIANLLATTSSVGGHVVAYACYNLEGHGFDSR